MSIALAELQKHGKVLIIDTLLLAALYLLPSFSHLTALPLYKFEPMRIALIVALLFTNRGNSYLIAFTIPLASAFVTGHPEPFKALLMGIEFSVLVACYGHLLKRLGWPAFVALLVSILLAKVVYYTMKLAALSAGWLSGGLVSTPVQTQLALALGTAVVFGLIEYYGSDRKRPPA